MLTIYGSPRTSAGRCFWCLEEAGVEYTHKEINMREKEHKSAEFLKINPNGKIPALVDGDFTIWESTGINFYIAEAYKPELLGKNAQVKGLVHQWSIWAMVDLQPPMIDIFIQKIFVPEERRNQEVIDKAMAKLPALFETLERTLSKQRYLADSDVFTLGDLNTASVISISYQIGVSLGEYPALKAWMEGMNKREACRRYMALCR